MPSAWALVCVACGTSSSETCVSSCRACGAALLVQYNRLPPMLAGTASRGLSRYRDWLPLADLDRLITLGEGETPVVRLERWPRSLGLDSVYAKLEYAGPTGSFKDRGAAVLVSCLLAAGVRRITEDSSGNAGAAIAAYAAKAGVECEVFAPDSAPAGKLAQIAAYGAKLRRVCGSREDVAAAVIAAAQGAGACYAGHNSNPFFVEGTKTFAFELAESFPARLPDHIIMPVGGGSLYCGAALGFEQLRSAGISTTLPHLHLVQARACMPLVAAFETGVASPVPVRMQPTVAGGISIADPPRGSLILRALRDSGGTAVAVEEAEILESQRELARLEGIFMEATSAAAFAGLKRLKAAGVIRSQDCVVVAVTGTGLKESGA